MGAQNSNLRRCIQDEFQRLKKGNRESLVLDEVLQLRLPPSQWMVDTSHLGVLFVMDSNRDGHITLEKLFSFEDLARQRSRRYPPHDFQSHMQGFCTLRLWKALSTESGVADFVQWMVDLLCTNRTMDKHFKVLNNETWLRCDTVESLHQMLNVQEIQGHDFQAFFDLLQQVAEEQKLMELEDYRLDKWVPLSVVRLFLESMAAGILKVMGQIYPAHELINV